MKDKDKEFKSLNKETGMLEDIDEVRRVGVILVNILHRLLLSPSIRLTMSPGMFLDMVTTVIFSESLFHTLSEADAMRLASGLLGLGPLEMEEQIRELGLSEKLPPTHPDAASHKMPLDPLDPDNPLVRDSEVLRRSLERRKEKDSEKKAERVELPPTLEAFLKELSLEDKQEGL